MVALIQKMQHLPVCLSQLAGAKEAQGRRKIRKSTFLLQERERQIVQRNAPLNFEGLLFISCLQSSFISLLRVTV
jgi:hypothetical protein